MMYSAEIEALSEEEAKNDLRYALGVINAHDIVTERMENRIRALEAESASLREDIDSALGDLNECASSLDIELLGSGLTPRIHGLTLAVRGIVAEVKKDSERLEFAYRFVRERLESEDVLFQLTLLFGDAPEPCNCREAYCEHSRWFPPSLEDIRTAIDAARAAEEKEDD